MKTEPILSNSKSSISKKVEDLGLGESLKLAIGINVRANGSLVIGSGMLSETMNNRSTHAHWVEKRVAIIFIGGPLYALTIFLILK